MATYFGWTIEEISHIPGLSQDSVDELQEVLYWYYPKYYEWVEDPEGPVVGFNYKEIKILTHFSDDPEIRLIELMDNESIINRYKEKNSPKYVKSFKRWMKEALEPNDIKLIKNFLKITPPHEIEL